MRCSIKFGREGRVKKNANFWKVGKMLILYINGAGAINCDRCMCMYIVLLIGPEWWESHRYFTDFLHRFQDIPSISLKNKFSQSATFDIELGATRLSCHSIMRQMPLCYRSQKSRASPWTIYVFDTVAMFNGQLRPTLYPNGIRRRFSNPRVVRFFKIKNKSFHLKNRSAFKNKRWHTLGHQRKGKRNLMQRLVLLKWSITRTKKSTLF